MTLATIRPMRHPRAMPNPLCIKCNEREARSANPRSESGKLCQRCLLAERYEAKREREGTRKNRADVVDLTLVRVSAEAHAAFVDEAERRGVSVYVLASEVCEAAAKKFAKKFAKKK